MIKFSRPAGKFRALFERITYRQWLIIAAAVSVLLGLLVYFSLSGVDSKAKDEAKVEMVKVVVAKQDIPERTVIKDNMLKVVEVPADIVPAGAFTDVSEAVNYPTSTAIQQGDILTDRKVYKDVRMAGFTGTIPPNCRAVSVAITDITGVSGFAKAGDYVDVMVVFGKKEDGIKGEILMQNVLLLGINKTGTSAAKTQDKSSADDANKDKDSKDKKSGGDDSTLKGSSDAMATATLALPLDEALKLAVASQKGTIYLVLRPYAPSDIFTLDKDYFIPGDKPSVQNTNMTNSSQAPVRAAAPSVQQAPRSYTPPAPAVPARPAAPVMNSSNSIEVIRGIDSARVGVN